MFFRTLLTAATLNDRMLLERALNSEFGEQESNVLDKALIRASLHGNLDCVERLLAEGADIDAEDMDGDTSLMLAAANGHLSKSNCV